MVSDWMLINYLHGSLMILGFSSVKDPHVSASHRSRCIECLVAHQLVVGTEKKESGRRSGWP